MWPVLPSGPSLDALPPTLPSEGWGASAAAAFVGCQLPWGCRIVPLLAAGVVPGPPVVWLVAVDEPTLPPLVRLSPPRVSWVLHPQGGRCCGAGLSSRADLGGRGGPVVQLRLCLGGVCWPGGGEGDRPLGAPAIRSIHCVGGGVLAGPGCVFPGLPSRAPPWRVGLSRAMGALACLTKPGLTAPSKEEGLVGTSG